MLHQQAVEDVASNLLDVVRCTSRTLTPEHQAELIARNRSEWPELWARIDELDELVPVLMAPTSTDASRLQRRHRRLRPASSP